jgi:hypothetical protein
MRIWHSQPLPIEMHISKELATDIQTRRQTPVREMRIFFECHGLYKNIEGMINWNMHIVGSDLL